MRKGYVPLKYAYTGSAAYTHDALARTEGYATVVGAASFEAETLLGVLGDRPSDQVAEVGVGNGTHTVAFLSALTAAAAPERMRYLGLDFSTTLLGLALPRIAAAFPGLDRTSGHWDLEEGRTRLISAWRGATGPVLVCLLGHTLGNLEDPEQALRNLASSTLPDDILLLGLNLMPQDADEEAVLAPYLNDVFRAAVLEPLCATSLTEDSLRLGLRTRGRAVIGEATFAEPVSVHGYDFTAHSTVRCFLSARYLVEEPLRLLRSAGWRVSGWAVDESATHMAVVARR